MSTSGFSGTPVPPLRRFLRFFFRHFYHELAWTYDAVAEVVSIGRWNDWVRSALPHVRGGRVLEIGHGPGHLQSALRRNRSGLVIGLDESAQMGGLARRRLRRTGLSRVDLVRGLAQALPCRSGAFDTVVSTFPAEYIFERQSLTEIRRVLAPEGVFVLLPAAWILGGALTDRIAAWLFRATNQAPREPADVIGGRLQALLEGAGFATAVQVAEVRGSRVLVLLARPAGT